MTAINREAESLISHTVVTRILDYNPETGLFFWKVDASNRLKAGERAGTLHGKYIRIGIDGRAFYAQRLAWLYVYKVWPVGIVDHIDRNPLNNSISNLRDTDYTVNNRNKNPQKRNVSGCPGVTFVEGSYMWRAQIRVNKKLVHIGCFVSKEAAIQAREAAEKRYT